ncbi:MAG: DUF1922 domain-containing protein [Candidatus Bathyarchaeia archaeon]
MTYIIFRCCACGRLVLGRECQKTRLCGYCGKRNNLSESRVEAEAPTHREALRVLAKLRFEGHCKVERLDG